MRDVPPPASGLLKSAIDALRRRDIAVGIVMTVEGVDRDTALESLSEASRTSGTGLDDLATSLISAVSAGRVVRPATDERSG